MVLRSQNLYLRYLEAFPSHLSSSQPLVNGVVITADVTTSDSQAFRLVCVLTMCTYDVIEFTQ